MDEERVKTITDASIDEVNGTVRFTGDHGFTKYTVSSKIGESLFAFRTYTKSEMIGSFTESVDHKALCIFTMPLKEASRTSTLGDESSWIDVSAVTNGGTKPAVKFHLPLELDESAIFSVYAAIEGKGNKARTGPALERRVEDVGDKAFSSLTKALKGLVTGFFRSGRWWIIYPGLILILLMTLFLWLRHAGNSKAAAGDWCIQTMVEKCYSQEGQIKLIDRSASPAPLAATEPKVAAQPQPSPTPQPVPTLGVQITPPPSAQPMAQQTPPPGGQTVPIGEMKKEEKDSLKVTTTTSATGTYSEDSSRVTRTPIFQDTPATTPSPAPVQPPIAQSVTMTSGSNTMTFPAFNGSFNINGGGNTVEINSHNTIGDQNMAIGITETAPRNGCIPPVEPATNVTQVTWEDTIKPGETVSYYNQNGWNVTPYFGANINNELIGYRSEVSGPNRILCAGYQMSVVQGCNRSQKVRFVATRVPGYHCGHR